MPESSRDRSIRNVPVSAGHRRPPHATPTSRREYADENDERGIPPPRRQKLPRRRSRIWWLLGGVAVLCIIIGLILSAVFEGATVTITPKVVAMSAPQTLTAQPQGSTGVLIYQTITANQTASTTITANGTQRVSRAATGMVTLYNTYSTAPQKLIANTRLETKDGKIYRIRDAVTVPGITKKPDGSSAPGTITVSVNAEKPGAEYNQSSSVQLSIPGFKGDPRYTKFVGQSQGAISGGFVGDEPAVSPADMATAQNELKRQLDTNIRSVTTSQIPEDFVGVNGSLGVTYTPINQSSGSGKTVVLSQGVTATVVMVRANDLAHALAKQAIPGYQDEPIAFSDLSKVTVALSGDSATSVTGPLSVTIGGNPELVWQFNVEDLRAALLGKNKSQFLEVVKAFEPAVAKGQATIRPFWKATFPQEAGKVTIRVTP